jgi:hypothetical protein
VKRRHRVVDGAVQQLVRELKSGVMALLKAGEDESAAVLVQEDLSSSANCSIRPAPRASACKTVTPNFWAQAAVIAAPAC